ncbi:MAG: 50S ribosomal protein L4 [Deltaproteobacteria bacterium]|nr:50S ribosomal protein L4 [Deltaproteobacteria bacterium]
MAKVDVYNIAKKKVGSVDLDEATFGVEVKEHLFHLVVRAQLAARRQGTHATKQRAMVAGGGRKPWKQKGTGRARQGSTRAPHWRGGGSVFGPQPRSHAFMVNKKVRRAALKCALSRRAGESAMVVIDQFALAEAKTKHFRSFMKSFGFDSLLVVIPAADEKVQLAARNIPGVTVLPVTGLNVYDVLRHKNLAVAQGALEPIVARLSGNEVSNG